MNRRLALPVCTAVAVFLAAAVALARPVFAELQEDAVVALHVGVHANKFEQNPRPDFDCTGFTTHRPVGEGAVVWLVVARGDSALGIAGVSFMLRYPQDGVTVPAGEGIAWFEQWPLTDLVYQTSGFPGSGTASRLVWNPTLRCRRTTYASGVQAIPFAVYVYASGPGVFEVAPVNSLDGGEVIDCNEAPARYGPEDRGRIGFGPAGDPAYAGYNPCAPVPVRIATWGRIKAHYAPKEETP